MQFRQPDLVEQITDALGMDVIAEGVEETDRVSALKTLGCGFAQGYYFWRPVASEEAEMLIAHQVEVDQAVRAPEIETQLHRVP
jgi:EAL domain-containing protein (putative c-di-GMP-specific phosphodiesterase class I)